MDSHAKSVWNGGDTFASWMELDAEDLTDLIFQCEDGRRCGEVAPQIMRASPLDAKRAQMRP